MVHICFPHHERVHRPGPTTSQRVDRDLLREVSVNRLDAWLHEQFSYDTEDRDTDLRARFRYLVRIAIDNDLNPPGFKEETHA